jgi:LSD1 subclass zinc finger protein
MTNKNTNDDSQSRELNAQSIDLSALWQQFTSEFPTKESCIDELYRRAPELLVCHHCALPLVPSRSGARVIRCSSCHNDTWPTAGTFFNRMRSPRTWLAIFWFFDKGVPLIKGWKLHELSGIAPSSASDLLRKVTTVIRELLPEDSTVVSSEQFCRAFAKRSRETPARKHPRAEEDALRAAESHDQVTGSGETAEELPTLSQTAALPLLPPSEFSGNGDGIAPQAMDEPKLEDDEQRKVYSVLCNQPVHFDLLCDQTGLPADTLSGTLTMLELDGWVERRGGDYYLRIRKTEQHLNKGLQTGDSATVSEQVAAKVGEIIDFITATWGRISRKYLQNYVGMFWFFSDKGSCSVVSLLDACLQFGPVRDEQMINYVTPSMVKIGTT